MKKYLIIIISLVSIILLSSFVVRQKQSCESLCVDILSFTAQKLTSGSFIQWETAEETFTLGFDVYRSWDINKHGTKINTEFILAHPGSPFGFTYEITDSKKATFYWLKITRISGEVDWLVTTNTP